MWVTGCRIGWGLVPRFKQRLMIICGVLAASKMCVAQDESRYHDTYFGYSYNVRRTTIHYYNVRRTIHSYNVRSTNTCVTSWQACIWCANNLPTFIQCEKYKYTNTCVTFDRHLSGLWRANSLPTCIFAWHYVLWSILHYLVTKC